MKVWLPAVRTSSGTDVFTQRLAAALASGGVEVEVTWLPLAFELLPSLHRTLRTPPGCDVIHANSWTGGALLDRSLPVVVTVHHLVHDPEYAPYRTPLQAIYHRHHVYAWERAAIAGAKMVTAVSPHVAGSVAECLGRRDVQVIPNWVDCTRFTPPVGRTRSGGTPTRILCVANRSRRKGADLLEPLLRELGDGFELRCTGGLRGAPRRAERPSGLVVLGRLTDEELVDEYRRCDVVVSLSRYEGFGYSALEAMACGKPVVAFAAGGLREVVAHGDTGFLVPVGDIREAAARIRDLGASPALRDHMGSRGRVRAERYEDAWRSYVDVYRTAIASRHR